VHSAGEIYRALAPAVLGYLRAQRAPDPEDVLGEVFLQVARDLDRFSGDEHALRRWVFAIAHNRLLDARRRHSRRPAVADRDVPERPVPPPADPVDPGLIEALSTLTPDQREVIVLRFVADLSLEDVARITRRRAGAVKALQHRALESLSRVLDAG
jgi:RNA polymerase sigma-70 factor (ECF subfamily)